MYLYLHGIVIEACTGNCTMGPIRPPAPACRNTIASIKYTIHHNGDVQNKGKQQIVAVNATIASKRVTYDMDKTSMEVIGAD